jgi:hypothetical protein
LVFQGVSFLLALTSRPCTHSSPLPCVPHVPPNLILLNLICLIIYNYKNKIWWSAQTVEILIVQFSPASRHFTFWGRNILLSILFSNNVYIPLRERPNSIPIQNQLN